MRVRWRVRSRFKLSNQSADIRRESPWKVALYPFVRVFNQISQWVEQFFWSQIFLTANNFIIVKMSEKAITSQRAIYMEIRRMSH